MSETTSHSYSINPLSLTQIGVVHSCYHEKFGIPRTSNIVTAARGEVELFSPYGVEEALRDLEGISHLWIIFCFHQNSRTEWKPAVRPPRLGGNRKVGVFATRSPVRPNPLGLSVVEYFGYSTIKGGRAFLHIGGQDLVEGTPVYDIKPYIPESDLIENAKGGWVDNTGFPSELVVNFSEEAAVVAERVSQLIPTFRKTVEQAITSDPRPAYKRNDGEWGMTLYGYNIRWHVKELTATVYDISTNTRSNSLS